MINLQHRSYQKELMDDDDIPFPAIMQTLKELNTVNSRLGGHAITIKGTNKLDPGSQQTLICEIGCGGGDNLFAIYKKFLTRKKLVRFIGIDKNPECIQYARQHYSQLPCDWICSDYAQVDFADQKPDIIFSSLFCHHFTNEELLLMLQWLVKNSKSGFFINDLHRHWLAFYLIKYITRIFSKSYLVKNDASLSVARGFRKKDWELLLEKAGIGEYQITWEWAFRWLVVVKNKN